MMKHLLIAAVAALPAWSAATAQDNRDIRVRVGLGAQLQPEFVGADDTEIAPLFDLDIARGTERVRVRSARRQLRHRRDLERTASRSARPATSQASRKDSDVGAPVGEVKTTIEAGAFANTKRAIRFAFAPKLLKGIGGHKGLVGTIGADQHLARRRQLCLLARAARAVLRCSLPTRIFRGQPGRVACVRPAGLPPQRRHPRASPLQAGCPTSSTTGWGCSDSRATSGWSGDAANSPIVREFGSRNQLSGGIGLNYTFTIQR